MNKRTILDTAMYLVAFALIQIAAAMAASLVCQTRDLTPMATIVTTLASSALAIALFAWRGWAPVSGQYIQTRPWFTLFWVACLAVGSSTPVAFLIEEAGLRMPDQYAQLFAGIMSHDLGYVAVGVVAPIAEEMVFRGAILRRLLDITGRRMAWVAIVVSAALFGVVHGNMAQGMNAFLMGLMLGWLYVRTRSIVPGVVMHIANNTMSFAMFRLMPGTEDMTLREFYGGDMKRVGLTLLFALMIFAAALFQLNMRLGHEQDSRKQ